MEIYRDFKELLELFNARGVEYLIVGGYALAHHGVPWNTRDIDLYVRPTQANAERIMAALDAFGFGQVGLSAKDFQEPDQRIQLGAPPVRIDLITSLTGVSWEQAVGGRSQGNYGGRPLPFLGRTELIANKKAAGRPQDLVDVERLERPPSDKASP
jgi:hypothetical protein